jgi:hypothetical protein
MNALSQRLDESDWWKVLSWSARCGTNRELALAVSLSESLFGPFLPATVRSRLAPDWFMERFVLSVYYPRALVWEWLPSAATHELAMMLYLCRGCRRKLRFLYRLVVPDRAALTYLYFGHRDAGFLKRIELHVNGVYVLLKVIFSMMFAGLVTRREILGSRWLDPERNKNAATA